MPLKDRVDVHLAEAMALMFDLSTGMTSCPSITPRFPAAVRLDHADDDIHACLAPFPPSDSIS